MHQFLKNGAAGRLPRAAFTLVEAMVAMAMGAVVLVATLTGVVALQKSYSATEEYADGLADQMRLLDYLALDLRRAVPVPASADGKTAAQPAWEMDADAQGLQIHVPNYYRFNASDPQHLFPVANDPIYSSTTGLVTYQDPSNPGVTTQTVAYRFLNGSITRTDPWQKLASNGSGGYVSTGPLTVASNMTAFPTITPDASMTDGSILHYNVTFYSIFQPFATTADATNPVTLHNVTFIRSKDLAH